MDVQNISKTLRLGQLEGGWITVAGVLGDGEAPVAELVRVDGTRSRMDLFRERENGWEIGSPVSRDSKQHAFYPERNYKWRRFFAPGESGWLWTGRENFESEYRLDVRVPEGVHLEAPGLSVPLHVSGQWGKISIGAYFDDDRDGLGSGAGYAVLALQDRVSDEFIVVDGAEYVVGHFGSKSDVHLTDVDEAEILVPAGTDDGPLVDALRVGFLGATLNGGHLVASDSELVRLQMSGDARANIETARVLDVGVSGGGSSSRPQLTAEGEYGAVFVRAGGADVVLSGRTRVAGIRAGKATTIDSGGLKVSKMAYVEGVDVSLSAEPGAQPVSVSNHRGQHFNGEGWQISKAAKPEFDWLGRVIDDRLQEARPSHEVMGISAEVDWDEISARSGQATSDGVRVETDTHFTPPSRLSAPPSLDHRDRLDPDDFLGPDDDVDPGDAGPPRGPRTTPPQTTGPGGGSAPTPRRTQRVEPGVDPRHGRGIGSGGSVPTDPSEVDYRLDLDTASPGTGAPDAAPRSRSHIEADAAPRQRPMTSAQRGRERVTQSHGHHADPPTTRAPASQPRPGGRAAPPRAFVKGPVEKDPTTAAPRTPPPAERVSPPPKATAPEPAAPTSPTPGSPSSPRTPGVGLV